MFFSVINPVPHWFESYPANFLKQVQRKIIHIDADCFYAAVEVRDNPKLKGLPIAVGGSATRRGVIATASYEARKFGVRSAMASATALRLCPNLTLIPGACLSIVKPRGKCAIYLLTIPI